MAIHGERWVGANADAVADEAARRFVQSAKQSIGARGRFTVALAGGSTPKAMYERLAKAPLANEVDWPRVEVFFSDERSVPGDHPDSNYGLAARTLLAHVPVEKTKIHRIEGEKASADQDYVATLERIFGGNALPVFDLIFLGMGPDGHTASLFPHSPALKEQSKWVVGNWVEKLKTQRYTFTPKLINAAREVLITASGTEKAPVLKAIANDPKDTEEHPVLMVRPTPGKLAWLVDKAAVAEI